MMRLIVLGQRNEGLPAFAATAPYILLIMALGCLAGCTLSKPNPAKQQFLVETRRPMHAAPPRTQEILKVRPFRVASAFDQRSFVYRRGEAQYESDFYHQLFVVPGNLFAEQTRLWLNDAGIFASVLPPASVLDGTFYLKGTVTRLYGDFRDPKAPKAVLGLEFALIRNSSDRTAIRFQRRYRQEASLERMSPAALAQGWTRCLEDIFHSFEKDLLSLDWRDPT